MARITDPIALLWTLMGLLIVCALAAGTCLLDRLVGSPERDRERVQEQNRSAKGQAGRTDARH